MSTYVSEHAAENQSKQKIGMTLRRLRLDKGFTQKQIAGVLDVSFQQVQKYEMGQNRLPIEKMFALKQLYNIPFEDFFMDFTATPQQTDNPIYYEGIEQRFQTLSNNDTKTKIYKILDILLSS